MRLKLSPQDIRKIKKIDTLDVGLLNTSVYKNGTSVKKVMKALNDRTTDPNPWVEPFLKLVTNTTDFLIKGVKYLLGNKSVKAEDVENSFSDTFKDSIKPAPSIYGRNTQAWARKKGFNRPLYHTGFLRQTTFARSELGNNSNLFR